MPEMTDDRTSPETYGLHQWEDGWIKGKAYKTGDDGEPVETPNNSGPFTAPPRYIVLHYTATDWDTHDAVCDYFHDPLRTSVSAHFVVGVGPNGHDPVVRQCLPVDLVGHHAGRSSWRGQSGLNSRSIGIEITNFGWLNERADGFFESWTGVGFDGEKVVRADHWHDGWSRYWHKYPRDQVDAVEALCRAILAQVPSVREIVTHEMISPGRKADTGPAFPRQRFLNLVENRASDGHPSLGRVRVAVPVLNVRGGPSTAFDTMSWGPVSRGDVLTVIDEHRRWLFVRKKHGAHQGWVHGDYAEPVD